jgi:alpha-aminoadipate/glutamate carrier protein LysW
MNVECKDCGAEIDAAQDVMVGEIITCPDCGADFEIVLKKGESIEVKPAETVGEDWGQ